MKEICDSCLATFLKLYLSLTFLVLSMKKFETWVIEDEFSARVCGEETNKRSF
jgi:hypothetical protein